MIANMSLTCLAVAGGALMSGAMFGPGDIPKQLFVVSMWYFIGFGTAALWMRG